VCSIFRFIIKGHEQACICLEVHKSQANNQYHKTITCLRRTKWSHMNLKPRVQFQSSPYLICSGSGTGACLFLQVLGVYPAAYHFKSTPDSHLLSNRPLGRCSTNELSITPRSTGSRNEQNLTSSRYSLGHCVQAKFLRSYLSSWYGVKVSGGVFITH
jgi:hypothetical protein